MRTMMQRVIMSLTISAVGSAFLTLANYYVGGPTWIGYVLAIVCGGLVGIWLPVWKSASPAQGEQQP